MPSPASPCLACHTTPSLARLRLASPHQNTLSQRCFNTPTSPAKWVGVFKEDRGDLLQHAPLEALHKSSVFRSLLLLPRRPRAGRKAEAVRLFIF
jgi:hypothetical protein